jgi:hypothetical protein
MKKYEVRFVSVDSESGISVISVGQSTVTNSQATWYSPKHVADNFVPRETHSMLQEDMRTLKGQYRASNSKVDDLVQRVAATDDELSQARHDLELEQLTIESYNNSSKELKAKLRTANDRIQELETQIKMQEPLKSFEVVYGDGYAEIVEGHVVSPFGTKYTVSLHDGTRVAEFHDVKSVVEVPF